MFGSNLRDLAAEYPSISDLARRLGINRTQFNRYLSGDSFPRPDVLARICDFFSVDARILLEPLDLVRQSPARSGSDYLDAFMGPQVRNVSEESFPSGFYRFTRRSFVKESQFVTGLVLVHRRDQETYLRGFEAKAALRLQGLPVDKRTREFRAAIMEIDDAITFTASRVHGLTASFNYLARVASFENNFWVGYVARTSRENSGSNRLTRLVYEHLGPGTRKALGAARTVGFCTIDELPPFHERLLQPDTPFR
jgi:transcriptional regulator with XRE-family HTH domain